MGGMIYNIDEINATMLPSYDNDLTIKRKYITQIMHRVIEFININGRLPNIYFNEFFYYEITYDKNILNPIITINENESVCSLMGYDVFIDNNLDDNEFFIGGISDMIVMRRKQKINKILKKDDI